MLIVLVAPHSFLDGAGAGVGILHSMIPIWRHSLGLFFCVLESLLDQLVQIFRDDIVNHMTL